METKILKLNDFINTGKISDSDARMINEAADIIRSGGLVAFPTETVYGLGGSALLKKAARDIYAAKGRPSDNPLIVHVSDMADISPLVKCVPAKAELLAKRFWPGPMTMIFSKSDLVPAETTGGLDTVAVRYPSHPVAAMLIAKSGVPVAAPSANRSGRPSTTTGEHCVEDLFGRVDAILDGGPCEIGLESTIIDVTGDEPQLLRPGAVTKEMLEEALNEAVAEDDALKGPLPDGTRPKAPGMKYRHYAPEAPMVLVTAGESDKASGNMSLRDGTYEAGVIAAKIRKLISDKKNEYKNIALLCSEECLEAVGELDGIDIKVLGSRRNEREIAHRLFDELRQFDADKVDFIVAEGYGETDMWMAVMNRLKKAAAWQIV